MKTAFVTTAASFLSQPNEKPSLSMCLDCTEEMVPQRRSVLRKMASTLVGAAGSTHVWITNGHRLGCRCSNCKDSDSLAINESYNMFGPMPAYAYERDVGDSGRSADTYAQNLQVRIIPK